MVENTRCSRMQFQAELKDAYMHRDIRRQMKLYGARDSLLTNLSRMSSSGHILGSYSFLYTIYFLLIPFAITRSILFGFLQCRLQSFNSFRCSSKSLLQFRKFTAEICIITYQLQKQNRLFSWYLSLWGEPTKHPPAPQQAKQ